jgi:hypothetical protein
MPAILSNNLQAQRRNIFKDATKAYPLDRDSTPRINNLSLRILLQKSPTLRTSNLSRDKFQANPNGEQYAPPSTGCGIFDCFKFWQ